MDIELENIWLKAVLNTTSESIIAIETNGCIKFMNHIAQQLIGVEEKNAIGIHHSEIIEFESLHGKPNDIFSIESISDNRIEGEIYNKITKTYYRVSGSISNIRNKNKCPINGHYRR